MSSSKKLRALVVDDNPVIQKLHSLYLKRIGLETQVAKNGKEAVDLYRSGASFNLVLMDMEMPVMDGLTATKELRGMGVDSMIVGISTRDEDLNKRAFMDAGLDDFRSKPLTLDTLTSLLQQLNNSLSQKKTQN